MLVGNTVTCVDATLVPCFDGQREVFETRLSDESRTLVALRRSGGSDEAVRAAALALVRPGAPNHAVNTLETSPTAFGIVLYALDQLVDEWDKLSDRYCDVCGAESAQLCRGCEAIAYCGVDHQRVDWPAHKAWCRAHRMAKLSA